MFFIRIYIQRKIKSNYIYIVSQLMIEFTLKKGETIARKKKERTKQQR